MRFSINRRIIGLLSIATLALTCGGPATPTAGPAGGGTGAFGVVTVNGVQKLYLPLNPGALPNGHNGIAVVDVGITGNGTMGAAALISNIDLGTTDYATTTGGDATIMLAASTDSKKVWFIDPTTDTLTGMIDLDATYGTSSFSGGGGYVTGIAMDSQNHRAILSVWNGFAIVDTTSKTITSVILAAPSENFGFDAANQRIFAPFYGCTSASGGTGANVMPPPCDSYKDAMGGSITEGLNVIDLKENPPVVYTYLDPQAMPTTRPVGSEPDSAAVDVSNGLVAIPSEGGITTTMGTVHQNLLDFGRASFDKSKKTVTAPRITFASSGRIDGVSIDPVQHIGFWEAEAGSDIAVMDLVKANGGTVSFLRATMPSKPNNEGSWSNLFDPHGIAVTTGIQNNKPVGFVVDSARKWVARVDLAELLKITPVANTTATGEQIKGAVTFLDASTPR